jgi:type IV secretory pathway protease TraF
MDGINFKRRAAGRKANKMRLTVRVPLRWIGGLLVLAVGIRAALPIVVVYAPSASLPKGWYLRDFATRDLAIGDVVVVEMPQGVWTTESVEGHPPRLLKQVAGMPGTRVCWHAEGMTVVTAQGAVVYPYHAEKRSLRRADGCLTVPAQHLVLVGTHPRSFDSRYIGIVDGHLFQFRVRPLWTWETA